jgi:dTDP-glucose 4,6-dehydratase
VGGGNQPTNLEVVRRVCAILDERLPDSPHAPHANLIRFVEDRPGHDRRYALDASRVRHELGWRPTHSLESGLRATVEWYLENPDWVRATLDRSEYREWMTRHYGDGGVGPGEARFSPAVP